MFPLCTVPFIYLFIVSDNTLNAECRTGDTEQCLHCMHQFYLVPRYKGFTPRLFTLWTSINLFD